MNDMYKLIKSTIIKTVAETKPMSFVVGTVKSASPLEIVIDQKISIDDDFCTLSRNVTNYKTEITEENGTKRKITINNELKAGDKAIMLRYNNGQNFFVIDKAV